MRAALSALLLLLVFAGNSSSPMLERPAAESGTLAAAAPQAAVTFAAVPQYCIYVVNTAVGACGGIGKGDVVCATCNRPCEAASCIGRVRVGRLTLECVLDVSLTEAYGRSCGTCYTGIRGMHILEPGWLCS